MDTNDIKARIRLFVKAWTIRDATYRDLASGQETRGGEKQLLLWILAPNARRDDGRPLGGRIPCTGRDPDELAGTLLDLLQDADLEPGSRFIIYVYEKGSKNRLPGSANNSGEIQAPTRDPGEAEEDGEPSDLPGRASEGGVLRAALANVERSLKIANSTLDARAADQRGTARDLAERERRIVEREEALVQERVQMERLHLEKGENLDKRALLVIEKVGNASTEIQKNAREAMEFAIKQGIIAADKVSEFGLLIQGVSEGVINAGKKGALESVFEGMPADQKAAILMGGVQTLSQLGVQIASAVGKPKVTPENAGNLLSEIFDLIGEKPEAIPDERYDLLISVLQKRREEAAKKRG